jgi:hypothetical protein
MEEAEMSVSIALLPVALVMRLVMGKEGFENFVKSQEHRVKTDFSSEAELSHAVKKSGHDVIRFGNKLLKTHLRGETDFFFWEMVDGRWEAIFSIHDDPEMLRQFMVRVELAAGRGVFRRGTQEQRRIVGEVEQAAGRGVSHQDTARAAAPMRFPTNFTDAKLLLEALRDFGANPAQTNAGDIICRVGKSELRFTQRDGQAFSVEISDAPDLEQIYQHLADIDEDYKRCVQTAVYEKVKARAESQGLILEGEEVLEDRTILMTLQIR